MAFNNEDVRKAILERNMENVRQALFKQPAYRTLTEAALEMSAIAKMDFYDALSITQQSSLPDMKDD